MKTIPLLLFLLFTLAETHAQNLCYRTQTPHSEKGYLGKIHGQKLYYEVWNEYPAGDTAGHYTTLLLRTDTSDQREKMDFCIYERQDGFYKPGYITCTLFRQGDELQFKTSSINVSRVPTLFQVVIPSMYGGQQFSGFNKKGAARIKFRGNTLRIRYLENTHSSYTKVLKYRWKHGKFYPADLTKDFKKGKIPTAIDQLKDTRETQKFIIPVMPAYANDKTYLADTFYRADIDGDGLTDLLIKGKYHDYIIFDRGYDGYSWKMSSNSRLEICYSAKEKLPLIKRTHERYASFEYDTLIFKFGDLIPYNPHPVHKNIDSILVDNWGDGSSTVIRNRQAVSYYYIPPRDSLSDTQLEKRTGASISKQTWQELGDLIDYLKLNDPIKQQPFDMERADAYFTLYYSGTKHSPNIKYHPDAGDILLSNRLKELLSQLKWRKL